MNISALVVIVAGILAAAPLIVAKKPNAKELIDKMVPYQGWIGIVLFFWGVWDTISVISGMALLSIAPVLWIIALLISLTELFVGFLLGYALISHYVLSKNEAAKKKGEEIRMKLMPYQTKLGVLAIVFGLLGFILPIIL